MFFIDREIDGISIKEDKIRCITTYKIPEIESWGCGRIGCLDDKGGRTQKKQNTKDRTVRTKNENKFHYDV